LGIDLEWTVESGGGGGEKLLSERYNKVKEFKNAQHIFFIFLKL
jgi:hypothetical protein